jgi:hypothetical protein
MQRGKSLDPSGCSSEIILKKTDLIQDILL